MPKRGLLVTYLSWRWVFFVNVPIGLAVAALAPRVLGESERRRGRSDLPGAITGSLGLAASHCAQRSSSASVGGRVPYPRRICALWYSIVRPRQEYLANSAGVVAAPDASPLPSPPPWRVLVRPAGEADDHDHLQRHPNAPTCHLPRPCSKLPHRARRAFQARTARPYPRRSAPA